MLEVGCPDPALVEERTESTRNWAARSATASGLLPGVSSVIVMITPVCGLVVMTAALTLAPRCLKLGLFVVLNPSSLAR